MTSTRLVVGLTGLAGAGKSTVAAEFQYAGFTRLRFAGPLKTMMRVIGLTEAQVDGDQKEVPCDLLCGKTPRHAMQTIGTEWGRDLIGAQLWVNAWKSQVENTANYIPVVADDVRFPNEVDVIRSMGGVIIEVKRPGLVVSAVAHSSEHLDVEPEITFSNFGPLKICQEQARKLAFQLRGVEPALAA